MEKFNIKVERETYVSKKTGKENFTYFWKDFKNVYCI